MIKIILVDDHPLVREGIAARLNLQDNISIISEAENGGQLLEQLNTLTPDIVLMDISMPELNGLEALKIIKQQHPNLRVIILSMHDDKEYIISAIRLGVCGYLLKDISGEEMITALQKVYEDGKYFSNEISAILAQDSDSPSSDNLTPRERLILCLISQGYNNKNIAAELHISVRTVETHNRNIKQKLNIHSVSGLVRYAIDHRLDQ